MLQYNGFILFAALLFIQTVSLIGLSTVTELLINRKSLIYEVNQLDIENHFTMIANHLQRQTNRWEDAACLFPAMDVNTIKHFSYEWWIEHSCYDSNVNYIIEFLGSNPCSYTSNTSSSDFFTANYYRVTLAYFHYKGFPYRRQWTYIEPAQVKLACQNGNKHFVILGRQMTRNI